MILLFSNTDWYLYNFRLPLARALKAQGEDVVLVSPPGPYGVKLEQAGFRWISFPLSRRGVNPIHEIRTIVRLEKLYQDEKPDLVHHFTIKCVIYGSIAAHLAKVPQIINSITGLGFVFVSDKAGVHFLRWLVKWFYRLVLRGTRVIFQNEEDRELFQQLKLVQSEQTALVRGSGVSLERFNYSPEPDGIPLVVLSGRMLFSKGVKEYVEAARILHQEGVQVRLALVGNIDLDNPDGISEKQILDWQSEGCVEWWGWNEHIDEVFKQANIVCLPSYREGLPKALIEAMACGRAVVATDVPGCNDVVENELNGLLVPLYDSKALAIALRKLIINPGLRVKMGKAGRKIVEEKFSERQVIEETIRVYRSGK